MSSLQLPSNFLILDSSSRCFEDDIVYPFAFDEVIARKVGDGSLPPIVHLWRHQQAFVLGLRDRRLPHALEVMKRLENNGFSVTVRNSGGAAVPLDPGVMNISIICPNPSRNMEFHQDFEIMVQVIQGALQQLGSHVNKGEIEGSYCPGDYDLSVNGKKFCGIAQRRQIEAYVVQAFVVVSGSGQDRAKLVQEFYEQAASKDIKGYLDIHLHRMASLSELLGVDKMESFHEGLLSFLLQQGGRLGRQSDWSLFEEDILKMMVELKERYERRV